MSSALPRGMGRLTHRLPLLMGAMATFAALAGCAAPSSDEAFSTGEARLAEGDAVVTVDALNLRAGPDRGAPIVAVMKRGDRVRVTGPSQEGFAPVVFGEAVGWAWDEYLASSAPIAIGSLPDAVASLVAEATQKSPGTELGLAVLDLTTGEYAGGGDDVRHVSASAAKVMWVAAAMRAGANVADIAPPIFRSSDNYASGTAIDRAGGMDAVNAFYRDVAGMTNSLVANWSFGTRRVASDQGDMGGDNYFTARDVITFMRKLDAGELVGARTGELETYMTLSPRRGYGGWIGTLLPEGARATMMAKGGWLPPPSYAEYSTLNEVGIVQVPAGDRYAIAILSRHGEDFARQAAFVERASCVVYRTIAKDASLGCRD